MMGEGFTGSVEDGLDREAEWINRSALCTAVSLWEGLDGC